MKQTFNGAMHPLHCPKELSFTVLQGDPSKDGPFVMKLIFPVNYKTPTHWHPTTENITVLKEELIYGRRRKAGRG